MYDEGVTYLAPGVLFHLMSPFLQCRKQSVQYEKLPGALHQLFIDLHVQYVKKGTQKGRKKAINWQSYQVCFFNITTEKHSGHLLNSCSSSTFIQFDYKISILYHSCLQATADDHKHWEYSKVTQHL